VICHVLCSHTTHLVSWLGLLTYTWCSDAMMCGNQHVIGAACWPSTNECPSCRIDGAPIPCRYIRNQIEGLHFKCKPPLAPHSAHWKWEVLGYSICPTIEWMSVCDCRRKRMWCCRCAREVGEPRGGVPQTRSCTTVECASCRTNGADPASQRRVVDAKRTCVSFARCARL
jgi:hypothetical protein